MTQQVSHLGFKSQLAHLKDQKAECNPLQNLIVLDYMALQIPPLLCSHAHQKSKDKTKQK